MNLFPTNTKMLAKQEMWIWPNQARDIQNNPNGPDVTWGSPNLNQPRLFTANRMAVAYAIQNKLGRLEQTRNGKYYIVLPFSIFSTMSVGGGNTTPAASPAPHPKKRRAAPSVVTDYKIINTTDRKFGIQSVKGASSKQISKTFATREAAVSYIRGPLRRPNYTEN